MSNVAVQLIVEKGCFKPANEWSYDELKRRNYGMGQVLYANFKKARNPKFHNLAHVWGQKLVDNIEDFHKLRDAHLALKKIQLEGRIMCYEIPILINGAYEISHLQAHTLSFDGMDEAEFKDFCTRARDHVSEVYYPGMTAEAIGSIAEVWRE